MKKLKKQIFNALKLILIMFIMISSGVALYDQFTGSQIDPIKAILKFQTQPQYTSETSQEKDVEYTAWQKFKSTVYGAVTGKICDKYSAYGAISSDYTIYGDLRDLTIQSWRYITGEKTDVVVVTLSAAGVVLSTVPIPFKTIYLKGFNKWNPIVILGLSKSHVVIHTLKILKKYKLIGIAVPILALYLILSLLPSYLTAIVFIAAAAYLMIILFQIFKIKGELNA